MATDLDEAPQVDAVLLEGLQNPRDRLTILRLEHEILKFMQNLDQRQLEFQHMSSSYSRLAAHHVAEHYGLKSLLVDTKAGARIILTKTSETKFPAIRLCDVPTKATTLLLPPLSPTKLAIKRRPSPNCFSGEVTTFNRKDVKVPHARSVEERKEEYNKARARIFSEGSAESNSPRLCCPRILKLDTTLLEEIKRDFAKAKEVGTSESSRNADKENQCRVKASNRVAIFRDREKDKKDPDYDRSYDRYYQRVDPRYNFGVVPPQVIYNTHFHQHLHVPPPPAQAYPVNMMPDVAHNVYPQAVLVQAPQIGYHAPYPTAAAMPPFYHSFSEAPFIRPEPSYVQARHF